MAPEKNEKFFGNGGSGANGEIDILIRRIDNGIREKAEFLKVIRDPIGLLHGLQGLRDIIGNKLVKDAIADQISYIILEKNSGTPPEEMMLNTILYGPPGVGKTLIGEKLSKIWVAIGYLEDPEKTNESSNTIPLRDSPHKKINQFINEINSMLSGNPSSSSSDDKLFFFLVTLLFIVFIAILVVAFVYYRSAFSTGGMIAFVFVAFILFLVLLTAIYYYTTPETNNIQISIEQNNKPEIDLNKSVVPRGTFRRVNRNDLVDLYLGHTDKKTLKLLKESTGMVVFLDEIYQLINGSQDQYGKEALNVINQYMSENPGKIIFIAAGYKDEIRDNLFAIQPGLERRFLWKFDCNGYTKDELFEIFEKQALDCGRHFEGDDYLDIKEYFISEANCLKHFAADTKSLLHFAKLAHSKAFLNSGGKMDTHSLNISDIETGFKALKSNNVKTDGERPKMNSLYNYLAKEHGIPK